MNYFFKKGHCFLPLRMKQRKLLLFKNGVQWNTSVVVKLPVTILSLKVSLTHKLWYISRKHGTFIHSLKTQCSGGGRIHVLGIVLSFIEEVTVHSIMELPGKKCDN